MTNATPAPGNDTGLFDLDDLIAHARRLALMIDLATDLYDHIPGSGMQSMPYQQRHLGAALYTAKESADMLTANIEAYQNTKGA